MSGKVTLWEEKCDVTLQCGKISGWQQQGASATTTATRTAKNKRFRDSSRLHLTFVGQGWITYYACPWHHLFACLTRARSTRAKWNSCIWDHFIFDHLNSYLWMPTKEKFYEYVRNATHGKKCYVIQGSREMFLTVPAKVFHCFDADRQ